MSSINDPAILLIAYRRHESIKLILESCKKNGFKRIYVALDGPKLNSIQGKLDHDAIKKVVNEFRNSFMGEIFILSRLTNIGCAASVLSACNWIFETEEFAIILEDDCLPTDDFFEFSRLSFFKIKDDRSIWLSCGTQFAPSMTNTDTWFLSRYALNWGWATTKSKWFEIIDSMQSETKLLSCKLSIWENIYWNEGARRAHSGWVDVWDTILVQQMLRNNKFAILPKFPLVKNVGNDIYATNTFDSPNWVVLSPEKFEFPVSDPIHVKTIDRWLRKKLFHISPRHIFSTQVTRLHDFVKFAYKIRPTLIQRLKFAEENRSKIL